MNNNLKDIKLYCIKENDILINQIYRMENLVNSFSQHLNSCRNSIDKNISQHIKEVEKIKKFSLEKFLHGLLPILDSLENSVVYLDKKNIDTQLSLLDGIKITLSMFYSLLNSFVVNVINPANEKFNPLEHEVMSVKQDKNFQDGYVIEVFQKGYKLYDRVIRASKVLVAKNY